MKGSHDLSIQMFGAWKWTLYLNSSTTEFAISKSRSYDVERQFSRLNIRSCLWGLGVGIRDEGCKKIRHHEMRNKISRVKPSQYKTSSQNHESKNGHGGLKSLVSALPNFKERARVIFHGASSIAKLPFICQLWMRFWNIVKPSRNYRIWMG